MMYHKIQTKADVGWLGILDFIEDKFFTIPSDLVRGSLISRRKKRNWLFLSLLTGLFSVLGGVVGFLIGRWFFDGIRDILFANPSWKEQFDAVSVIFEKGGFYAVFISAFSPIPYKVFTISAGFFGTSFGVFMLASVLGRGIRFLLAGLLFHLFGKKIADVLNRFFWAATVIVLIGVAVYLAIRLL